MKWPFISVPAQFLMGASLVMFQIRIFGVTAALLTAILVVPKATSTVADEPTRESLAKAYFDRAGDGSKGHEAFRLQSASMFEFTSAVTSLSISHDGAVVVAGYRNPTRHVNRFRGTVSVEKGSFAPIYAWELDRGPNLVRLLGHPSEHVVDAAISWDRRYVASSAVDDDDESDFVIWNATTGEALKHFANGVRGHVGFSKANLLLADNRVGQFVVDVPNSKVLRSSNAGGTGFRPISFGEGNALLRVGLKHEIIATDLATGVNGKSLPLADGMRRFSSLAIAFAEREQLIATVHADHETESDFVLIRSWRNGQELRRLEFQRKSEVVAMQFVGEPARLATVSRLVKEGRMGELRVWDLQNGKSTFERPLGKEIGETAFDPHGRYLAIASDEKPCVDLVELQTGARVVRLNNYKDSRKWMCETIDGKVASAGEKGDDARPETADDAKYVASALRLLLSKGEPPASDPTPVEPPAEGRMFFLGVGVSETTVEALRLNYADDDVNAANAAFVEIAKPRYKEVLETRYVDAEATAENVLKGLKWLRQSCRPEDTAVIFFSGHGLRGERGLYYVPHDGDPKNLGFSSLVNWSDVAQSIVDTKAGRILLLSDCCHSGAAGNEFHRATQTELAEKFSRKKGFAMLTASEGDEFALEIEKLKHGAFTRAILDSLAENRPDLSRPNWGKAIRRLAEDVKQRVREMTRDKQHPTFSANDE